MVAMMAFSVIFAMALAHLAGQSSGRRRAVLAIIGVLLAFELAPLPKTLYSAEIPEVYRIIARDPRDVRVLELPFGIRSGEWSEGNFTAASQFYQTIHEKPLIGGYLSRISRGVVERQHQYTGAAADAFERGPHHAHRSRRRLGSACSGLHRAGPRRLRRHGHGQDNPAPARGRDSRLPPRQDRRGPGTRAVRAPAIGCRTGYSCRSAMMGSMRAAQARTKPAGPL